ncbi:hypothetical protein Lgee_2245 [Legionella geestiana]|uniref:Uncharacterized protein n=1 Tax=Legionella geestiana TaxID=45065 RepID=A0A0W0TJW2_9GAMM|nr:hypothetical protein [Legionella geestiana]KTC95865.1 hypothetical protein Lgee_2245 [Legionella geestiana]QBS13277.1 hypothetical protein E4T54_11270 [Legionella geestiana]STX54197.1 Uncharacterised protein [Legionella geestiana]
MQKSLAAGLMLSAFFLIHTNASAKNDGIINPDSFLSRPLMASNLSGEYDPGLLSIHGHTVLDTPVVVSDSTGKKISFQRAMRPGEDYTLVSHGKPRIQPFTIWFFSPAGSNQSEAPDYMDICTAENPCSVINQKIIDAIYRRSAKDEKVGLWFATGAYDIPADASHHNVQRLKLHGNQHILGRSADFLHNATGEERPLIRGSIYWSDFHGHSSTDNYVSGIRVETRLPRFWGASHGELVNLGSEGSISLYNTDLDMTLEEGSSAVVEVSNVYAGKYMVASHSRMSITGNHSQDHVLNVEVAGSWNGTTWIADSELHAEGAGVTNLFIQNNAVMIFDSEVNAHVTGQSGYSTSLSAYNGAGVEVKNSSITMRYESSDFINRVFGILFMHSHTGDKPPFFVIEDSTIDTFLSETAELLIESSATGVGILTESTPVHLQLRNAIIKAHAEKGKAFGVRQLDTQKDVRVSLEQPSLITLSGTEQDNFFKNIDDGKVRNISSPLSRCQFESGESRDC